MNIIFAVILSISALSLFSTVANAEPVRIGFVERAGYAYVDQGTPKGLLVDIAAKILSAAKVDFSFEALPQQRLVATNKDGTEPVCALGMFKNAERESFAVFTKPIYKNQPIGVLVLTSKKSNFAKFPTVADVVNDPNLTLGEINGFSYGGFVDDLISKMAGKKYTASVTPALLVSMLNAERIDYMFADPEEYEALADAVKVDRSAVTLLHFKDIPEGNQRYLMCSKAVPQATINKINTVIEP